MFDNIFQATTQTKKTFDPGLRKYFLLIYNYIALALVITGLSAFCALNFEPLARLIYKVGPGGVFYGITPIGRLFSFMPIIISIYMSMRYNTMKQEKVQMLFWAYSASMGIAISYLGLVYTGASLVKTFFICAASFGAISMYGYSTKRDLTSMGSFFVMGLIGI